MNVKPKAICKMKYQELAKKSTLVNNIGTRIMFCRIHNMGSCFMAIKCVFDGASPSLARALLIASKELHYWGLAGARGINYLLALVPSES
jgi:hypothetical protein